MKVTCFSAVVRLSQLVPLATKLAATSTKKPS
jgi:hypothetical protein